MKKEHLIFLTFFVISCATKPQKAPEIVQAKTSPYTQEEVWQAVYHLTIEFPVHEFSQEEGTLESEWIEENDLSRYRFFVSLNSDEIEFQKIPFFIDIDSQMRKNKSLPWRNTKPPADKQEKIKNHIYEHLKKNRAA